MSDDVILGPDGQPAPPPEKLIETDAHGDPIRQGSLMIEKQSYERVIEGLKIASDAAMHLLKQEGDTPTNWRGVASKLDQVRRACVQKAGLGLLMREKETTEVRGDPLTWRNARDRMREGLTQAAGGMRQLATCFRGDIWWSVCAGQVEEMARKIRNPKRMPIQRQPATSLILPDGFTRH